MSIRTLLKALSMSLGLALVWGAVQADAQQPQRATARQSARPAAPAAPAAPVVQPETAVEVPVEEPQAIAQLPDNVELIQERYPDGSIKIERYVTQDVEGNYINHGPWVQYTEAGKKVGAGEFRYGKQHGRWLRWFARGEGQILAAASYKAFKPPFVSEVLLEDGQLHGTWTIYDSQKLKCSEFEFENGRRHGKSIWYYPTGLRAREVDYHDGAIDGKVLGWDTADKLVQEETYVQGRKHANRVLYHAPGKKRAEGFVLHAKEAADSAYDWWTASISTAAPAEAGVDVKHGAWTWWYPNGQKYSEGNYVEDAPTGMWVFWHANGQKNMQGEYSAVDEKHELWTWWYPNGQKYSEGRYLEGQPAGMWQFWHNNGQKNMAGEYIAGARSGKWTWWKEDGTVLRVEEYGADGYTEGDDVAPPDLDDGQAGTDDDVPSVGTLRTPSFE